MTAVDRTPSSPPATPTLVDRLRRRLPEPARRALRQRVPARLRTRVAPTTPWSIAVARAPSPLTVDVSTARPVLDADAAHRHGIALLADPFAVRDEHGWSLFFELVRRGERRGCIGLATSTDLDTWRYHGVVLEEPFHLSYPSIVVEDGQRYLVPESGFDGSVRLYRARRYPTRWELDTVLLRGQPYKDATLFRHDGRWWMFVETSPQHTHDELRLLWADQLRGPWHEHPASPVVRGDAARARPAGRPVRVDGRLLRLAQDCARWYGEGVVGVEILELTPQRYRESPTAIAVLQPSGAGWNATGTHHLDAHELADTWVCFLDGKP